MRVNASVSARAAFSLALNGGDSARLQRDKDAVHAPHAFCFFNAYPDKTHNDSSVRLGYPLSAFKFFIQRDFSLMP